MNDWFLYLALPTIAISFAVIGGGLLLAYWLIRALIAMVAPANSHRAGHYFGYLWMAVVLTLLGYLLAEFGYQLNFWDAPGIWGAPGKVDTLWHPLQFILTIAGFIVAPIINAMLEQHSPAQATTRRAWITACVSVLLIITLMMSAWHSMQTLG